MFDRLLMPALTFTLLCASLAAFAVDAVQSRQRSQTVVQLERVVISAARELPATPLALAGNAPIEVAAR